MKKCKYVITWHMKCFSFNLQLHLCTNSSKGNVLQYITDSVKLRLKKCNLYLTCRQSFCVWNPSASWGRHGPSLGDFHISPSSIRGSIAQRLDPNPAHTVWRVHEVCLLAPLSWRRQIPSSHLWLLPCWIVGKSSSHFKTTSYYSAVQVNCGSWTVDHGWNEWW